MAKKRRRVEVIPEKGYVAADDRPPKPFRWVASSKRDLEGLPAAVGMRISTALTAAQMGSKAPYAKPLRGFGGASVLEIVADHRGDTYRAVYTVKFAEAVYVLHAFQKKSKHGIATPKAEMALIAKRLQRAEEDYRQWRQSRKKTKSK